ncbi:MAG: phospho-N-acetylmuramoyl-pentapeptide-transferase [Akkermansiaceae bacterium]|jgi:phospho-N-acetylmuramoyl-pentapeptide-transferase|nr:phospho-N-acetylmuramoyl-pentapeptide-transferase [Akkermansiaceae bacterium]MDP4647867.1 phospho-N-acetylmuramoyl-pentapeptide-transferase [Akkermansiaceae bacterium]MDP4722027.1 phospho-N-acetylmuramoyl-pentapeptide-transferase [Akkermansiaceae bacterium]MDP4780516.1 phospho-N-acetylmuramoyl-pentapeptide-transferase [Akkermansiaceae bacterium]MDP4846116.1 phospho-N-acetylmuramoyl-pentapeptide-transferase [Akkermansiaceae bacterium]
MLTAIYDYWYAALQAEILAGDKNGWAHTFSFLNLFGYVTFRAATAGLLSFSLSILLGPRIIRKLISLKVGQPIRTAEEVHKLAELHGGKLGTPTMGGVLILATVLISTLICARVFNPFVAVCACTMCACGLLGFVDDYTKVKKKNSDGVSSRTKLFWQFVIALIASCFIYFKTEISGFGATAQQIQEGAAGFRLGDQRIGIDAICFPLIKIPIIDVGIFIIPFFILIIIGCSNAVNLTDGLDGLATGCTISVALSYAMLAYLAGHFFMSTEYLVIPHNRYIAELAVFLMALAGAAFGFLWFNCHPAKVFMGDTGSLAIGGALGTAAICTKQELLLVIIGGVFVMEAASVMLQVGSFKLRKKRIFKMAPIHHHFELLGWHESQVIIRFWILSIMLALFGMALLKIV